MKEGEGRGGVVSATEKGVPHLTAAYRCPFCSLLLVDSDKMVDTYITSHSVLTEPPPEWPRMNPALPNSGFSVMSTTPFTTQQARLRSLKDTRKCFPSPLQHSSQETLRHTSSRTGHGWPSGFCMFKPPSQQTLDLHRHFRPATWANKPQKRQQPRTRTPKQSISW